MIRLAKNSLIILSCVATVASAVAETTSHVIYNLTPEGLRNEAVSNTISAVDLYIASDISNGIKSASRAIVFFNILMEDSSNSSIMPPPSVMQELLQVLSLLSDPPSEFREYLQEMDSDQSMAFITFVKIFEVKVRLAFQEWIPGLMDKSSIKTPIIERKE